MKDGSGKLVLESDKGAKEEGFDVVLMATGRVPNIGSLGLDKAGVKVSPQGYIDVDGEAHRGHTPQQRGSTESPRLRPLCWREF